MADKFGRFVSYFKNLVTSPSKEGTSTSSSSTDSVKTGSPTQQPRHNVSSSNEPNPLNAMASLAIQLEEQSKNPKPSSPLPIDKGTPTENPSPDMTTPLHPTTASTPMSSSSEPPTSVSKTPPQTPPPQNPPSPIDQNPSSPPVDSMTPIPTVETPVRTVLPGEEGNAIDPESPPDFEQIRKTHGPLGGEFRRVSKRLRGISPSAFEEGEGSARPKSSKKQRVGLRQESVVNQTIDSGDDSADSDYKMEEQSSSDTETDEEKSEFWEKDVTENAMASANTGDPGSDAEFDAEFDAACDDYQRSSEGAQQGKDDVMSEDNIPLAELRARLKEQERNARVEDSETEPEEVSEKDDDEVTDSEFDPSKAVSSLFYSESSYASWSKLRKRKLIVERCIFWDDFQKYNLICLLKKYKLLKSITTFVPFVENVILEVYCNLEKRFHQDFSKKFGKVYLRGRTYSLNPEVLNGYLETDSASVAPLSVGLNAITEVITGGLISEWPKSPKKLRTSNLTSMYATLCRVAAQNWLPSTNTSTVTFEQAELIYRIGTGLPINLGRMMFDAIAKHIGKDDESGSFPFPSLIFAILKEQGFEKKNDERLVEPHALLKIDQRFFKPPHIQDLPYNSGLQVAGPSATESVRPRAMAHRTMPPLFVPPMPTNLPSSVFVPREFALAQVKQAQQMLNLYTSIRDEWLAHLSTQKGGDEAGPSSTKNEEEGVADSDGDDSSDDSEKEIDYSDEEESIGAEKEKEEEDDEDDDGSESNEHWS